MRSSILLITLCLIVTPICSTAAVETNIEIGVRGGVDNNDNNLKENYAAAELYFLKQLPWSKDFGECTTLNTRFDLGLIYIESADEEGFILAAGADLVLGLWDGNAEMELGFRPSWMSESSYGKDDYGGRIQFTSHVGLAINWQPVVLNYRYQHTSNSSIYDKNPGLNLHMIGMGYRF